MKLLLSAYACGPGFGSEPEVGLRMVIAAATEHEVWVMFRADFEEGLARALKEAGVASSVHLEPIEPGGLPPGLTEPGLPRPNLARQHLHYEKWQRAAARRGIRLHSRHRFDVVHHVTHAAYWTRAGVAAVDAPLIIGPVGGGVEAPIRLLPALGARGFAEYATRTVTRRVSQLRPDVSRALRSASLVLVQNPETVRRMPTSTLTIVHPNSTLIDVDGVAAVGRRNTDVAMCGRLAPWKGGTLAVRAIAKVAHPEATLVVYGTGPDRSRMALLADRLGVRPRVRFADQVARDDLLGLVAASGVLLHPSLHEEGGNAVAEALSLGTPLVALAQGGPAQSAALWTESPAALVSPSGVEATATRLARAIDSFLESPPPIPAEPLRPSVALHTIVAAAYERAARGA
jgi:glycosyltransferase involved in cell wall biosynthesis